MLMARGEVARSKASRLLSGMIFLRSPMLGTMATGGAINMSGARSQSFTLRKIRSSTSPTGLVRKRYSHKLIYWERESSTKASLACDALEDSNVVIKIEIHPIREWLVNARDLLYDMSQTPHEHRLLFSNNDIRDKIAKGEMHVDIKDKRDLWQGSGGSSLKRWIFWKQRLQELQSDADLDEGTLEVVREALDAKN